MKITKKKKNIHNFAYLKLNISYNNIFLTLTDKNGNVLIQNSSGKLGFKGSKKKNPYVASQVVKNTLQKLFKSEIKVKCIIFQIKSHVRASEIFNAISQAEDFFSSEKNLIKDPSTPKNSPIFYIQYVKLKAHNGIRKQKSRRL